MVDIDSLATLQQLVVAGETDWKPYGDVRAIYSGDLVLFNYTTSAQYAGRWNWFELNSRGLILNIKTGEIVALPFPKFFNWGEGGRTTDAPITSITEKIDGSLGILYRADNSYRIATRGMFEGEQALWATNYLNQHFKLDGLEDALTLLFEIIYPENRVVIDYGERQDLVLIGARNRVSGDTLDVGDLRMLAARFGFNMPQTYNFASVAEMIAATRELSVQNEGWVATFEDGSMFKFKGALYQLAHKLLTGVSFNQVVEAVASGQFDALIEGVPDEFLVTIRGYKQTIDDTVAKITDFVRHEMLSAPTTSRKEFALWIQQRKAHYESTLDINPAYFFAALDGKSLAALVYKYEFK